MSISIRSEYACKALIELALCSANNQIKQINKIAKAQAIPNKYLVHILLQLKKHDVVGSVRGANGGYFLKRSPDELSIGDVMRIVDGPILPFDCVSGNNEMPCNREEVCDFKLVWRGINMTINKLLNEITFSHILEQMQDANQNMYYI